VKVVLFCGGLGTRLGPLAEEVPKPLVLLGSIPILRHVMEYYAFHGHTDFILCLGHKGEAIARYFLDRADQRSVEISRERGSRRIGFPAGSARWQITFAETGDRASIGERLRSVRHLLAGETVFLANYADGLTDFPLPRLIEEFNGRKAVGIFLAVRPNVSFHFVRHAADGRVLSIDNVLQADAWINGGYFVFSTEIFDYIDAGEDLVEAPFRRLIDRGRLFSVEHDGFWRCVDTLKDLQALEELQRCGRAPWLLSRPPALTLPDSPALADA
jgi:glucose-1-phosphate cytidylyltransferase